MAKQTKSSKQVQVKDQRGHGIHQESTEIFDDNLLPEAAEITALHALDPGILEWLKERAEKEQDFRHVIFTERTKILKSDISGTKQQNILGMIFAFLIIIAGMGVSAYLMSLGSVITGSIFSGFTIIFAASLFYKRKPHISNSDN